MASIRKKAKKSKSKGGEDPEDEEVELTIEEQQG